MSRPRLLAAVAVLLGGCAGFSDDGGFDFARQAAREHLRADVERIRSDADRDRIEARVAELLAQPLGIDEAVQLALLNNRGLQAAWAELGIAEANLVRAGRLPNPHFSMLRTSRIEDGVREFKIEQALTFNVFALVTMPQVVAIERQRFEQTQRAVTLDMLRLAADTRRAWVEAVAARETLGYARRIREAAEAGAELARRMAQVGNFSRLQRAREQAFQADAALAVARAERAAGATRERLVRQLGLWGAQAAQLALPDRLPELPGEPRDLPEVERLAMSQRLDLAMVRLETEALARNLGLTRTTRVLNVLEFGPARVREGPRDAEYKRGYEVAFELPIFDFGGTRVAQAQALWERQIHLAADAAVAARSEVRDSYDAYRHAHDVALHYRREIVPLRKAISEENLLRYNGMLIGVFELLADARTQIGSVIAAIEATRDFWLAQSELEMALVGRPAPLRPTPGPLGALGAADAAPGH